MCKCNVNKSLCVCESVLCPDTDVTIVFYNEGKAYFSNWSLYSYYIIQSPTNSVCVKLHSHILWLIEFSKVYGIKYLILYITLILQGLISNNHPKVNKLNFCFIKATKVLYNVQENVILHFSLVEDHQSYSTWKLAS